jgi:hypothetical protein
MLGRSQPGDRACVIVDQPHARHALPRRAQCPGRAARNLRHQSRRQARRAGQAGSRLPLAAAGHRHIRRQNQRGEPAIARTGQHVVADARVARRVHLEPAVAVEMRRDILGRAAGDGGQAIGQPGFGGRARQQAFGIGPEQPRHAHRADPEGQGVVPPQQGGGQIGGEFAVQDRGHQKHLVELAAVARLRGLGARGAVEVFEGEPRDAAAGAGLEIGNGGVSSVQVHALLWGGRNRLARAPRESAGV